MPSNGFSFKCNVCEELHTEIPCFKIIGPSHFEALHREELYVRARNTRHTFIIDDKEYYIAVLLYLPIIGYEAAMTFETWAMVSKADFDFYNNWLKQPTILSKKKMNGWHDGSIYGLRCNKIRSTIHFFNKKLPIIRLEDSNQILSKAYHSGITLEKMIAIFEYYKFGKFQI